MSRPDDPHLDNFYDNHRALHEAADAQVTLDEAFTEAGVPEYDANNRHLTPAERVRWLGDQRDFYQRQLSIIQDALRDAIRANTQPLTRTTAPGPGGACPRCRATLLPMAHDRSQGGCSDCHWPTI